MDEIRKRAGLSEPGLILPVDRGLSHLPALTRDGRYRAVATGTALLLEQARADPFAGFTIPGRFKTLAALDEVDELWLKPKINFSLPEEKMMMISIQDWNSGVIQAGPYTWPWVILTGSIGATNQLLSAR